MSPLITGIHHVTAVSGDTQENIDFYSGVLGMRLIKKTVNFDYPEVYHFYFGNDKGTPGTIMTTFPYGKEGLAKGRKGTGKINTTAFSLPSSSLGYWLERLDRYRVAYSLPQKRGEEKFISLEDPDGLGIELVFDPKEEREGSDFFDNVPLEHSIRGIHHVEIWQGSIQRTAELLTEVMDHELLFQEANRSRYGVIDKPGHYIDLVEDPKAPRGYPGSAMVHHVAFATESRETQEKMIEKLEAFGIARMPVRERKYFSSIYFNEPGGVVFEIATLGPGFDVDEEFEDLGLNLQLPEQFEENRAKLNESLPKFTYSPEKFK